MGKRTHVYRVMPPDLHSRPTGGSPGFQYRMGEWTPPVKNPRICESGYHTLSVAGLLDFAHEGDVVVECHYRGQVSNGYVATKRTNESVMPVRIVGTITARALRLTAADAAESVAHIYNGRYPDDPTINAAIHTVRAFALGGATRAELAAAAYAAAYAAAADAYAADAAAYAAAYAAAAAAYAAAYAAAADAYAAAATAACEQSKRYMGERFMYHITHP